MPCRLLRRVGESFFGISYEDWLTTNDSNPSLLASEELTTAANTTPSRSNSEGISNSEDISNSRSDSEEISNSEDISNSRSDFEVIATLRISALREQTLRRSAILDRL